MIRYQVVAVCNNCETTQEVDFDDITASPEHVLIPHLEEWGWRREPGDYFLCEDCIPSCDCSCGCSTHVDSSGGECADCEATCHPTCACDKGCDNEVDDTGELCDFCLENHMEDDHAEDDDDEEEEEDEEVIEPEEELVTTVTVSANSITSDDYIMISTSGNFQSSDGEK